MVKEQDIFVNGTAPSKCVTRYSLRPNLDRNGNSHHVTSDFMVLLGPGLLSTEGVQHKKQRKLLNPVFSAAHLRNMSHIFYNVAHKVRLPV